jgi:hypothetical protein
MVDLGLWAGGDYRVPGAKVEDSEHPGAIEDREDLDDGRQRRKQGNRRSHE